MGGNGRSTASLAAGIVPPKSAHTGAIMLPDLWHALRQLRKSPGFTLTAVLTLALGIGATTAIFTLVQQVMLQSLPATQPEQLWRIGDQPRCCNWGGYSQGSDDEPNDWSLFPWEAYRLFRANTPGVPDRRRLPTRRMGNMSQAISSAPSAFLLGADVC
jgi:hypothetical protein